MNLADKIIKLRKQKGISQEELAEILNVSRQTISRWEVGTALPDALNLIQLSKVFDVSIDYLLNEEYNSENEIPCVKKGIKGEKEKMNIKTSVILFTIGFCLCVFDFYHYKLPKFDLLPDFVGWILILIGFYLIKDINNKFKKGIWFSTFGIVLSSFLMLLMSNDEFIGLKDTGLIGVMIGIVMQIPYLFTLILITLGIKDYQKINNVNERKILMLVITFMIVIFEIIYAAIYPFATSNESGLINFLVISRIVLLILYIVFLFLNIFDYNKKTLR